MKKEPLFKKRMECLINQWEVGKKSKIIQINCINCKKFNMKMECCKKGYLIKKIKLDEKTIKYMPFFYFSEKIKCKCECEYEYKY